MGKLTVWKLTSPPDRVSLEPIAIPEQIQTLDSASLCLPGGAYTTLRTYAGDHVLHFADHIHRLEETAQLAGLPHRLEEQALRLALRNLLQDCPKGKDFRIRLTLDLEQTPGELYILLEPLVVPPPQAYLAGVRVITCDIERRLPKAKLTRFINRSAKLRQSLPPDVNEAVMLDAQSRFLEGLSSNFFAILGGVVWTAEQDVLSGITRSIVIDCVNRSGLALRLDPPRRDDLGVFDEVFITSSSRGVLPVSQIDQSRIRDGCPGPVTRLLMEAFGIFLENHIEAI
jgi:branched-chain amino acid aminotransferase